MHKDFEEFVEKSACEKEFEAIVKKRENNLFSKMEQDT